MPWVIDTSVVLDLVTGDPLFEPASTVCLQTHLKDGLVISPVTFVELGPAFRGDDLAAQAFLKSARIGTSEFWDPADTFLAHRLWHDHQQRRRQLQVAKRTRSGRFDRCFRGAVPRDHLSEWRGFQKYCSDDIAGRTVNPPKEIK